jgi:hypothetical protein
VHERQLYELNELSRSIELQEKQLKSLQCCLIDGRVSDFFDRFGVEPKKELER